MPRLLIKLADNIINLGAFYDLEKPLPFVVQLFPDTGDPIDPFFVNDPDVGSQITDGERVGARVAFFYTPEIPEGLYRLEIHSPFSNRPLVVQDGLRVENHVTVFKLSLPDSSTDIEDPKLQANTVGMDVFADAPYCVRRRADGTFPDLPVLLFVKDIPFTGVTLQRPDFWCNNCQERHLLPDSMFKKMQDSTGKILSASDFPLKLKQAAGDPDSGLGKTPWWCITYLDLEELPQRQRCLKRGRYSRYAQVDYFELMVEIRYKMYYLIGKRSRTVLRTMLVERLPQFEDWYYGDTHYHSIYTENPAEFGGPQFPTQQIASAVGLDWVFLTDYSWDFTRDKNLKKLKPQDKWEKFIKWVPKTQALDTALLLPAEEITLSRSGTLGLHALSLEAQAEYLIQDRYFIGEVNLEEALMKLKTASAHNSLKPALFAAHPGSGSYCWGEVDCKEGKKSTFFMGLQVFNERVSGRRIVGGNIDNYQYDALHREIKPHKTYEEVQKALDIWRDQFLLPAVASFCEEAITSSTIIGGSDAHMDFNFALRPNPLFVSFYFSDNAFGKVRTFSYIPNFHKAKTYSERKHLLLESLRRGRCVVTDGPVIIPTLHISDGNESFQLICGKPEDNNSSEIYQWKKGAACRLDYHLALPEESLGDTIRVELIYPRKEGQAVKEVMEEIVLKASNLESNRNEGSFELNDIIKVAVKSFQGVYFRLQCKSILEGEEIGWCCTNAVWVKLSMDG